MQKPEIWADQKKASELGSQIRDIKDNLEFLEKWQGVIDDTETALEIYAEVRTRRRKYSPAPDLKNLLLHNKWGKS